MLKAGSFAIFETRETKNRKTSERELVKCTLQVQRVCRIRYKVVRLILSANIEPNRTCHRRCHDVSPHGTYDELLEENIRLDYITLRRLDLARVGEQNTQDTNIM